MQRMRKASCRLVCLEARNWNISDKGHMPHDTFFSLRLMQASTLVEIIVQISLAVSKSCVEKKGKH